MNPYVHSVREKRLAKNSYGANFRLLSAGSNRACHLLSSDLRPPLKMSKRKFTEGLMKDIWTILWTSVFVLFSLIVLLSAARTPDRTSSTLDNDQQRVSDLGLRFAFER
jgi:hypothetical protein